MGRSQKTWRVSEIPDVAYHRYLAEADGDLVGKLGHGFAGLLRYLAMQPSESAGLSVRSEYAPGGTSKHPQTRQGLSVSARASGTRKLKALSKLVEHGPVARFYPFEPADNNRPLPSCLQAACHVFRRDTCLPSAIASDLNPDVPALYYICNLLEANEENDLQDLDRLLSAIDETVVIDLCVEPCQIDRERALHTEMMSLTRNLGRSWGSTSRLDSVDMVLDESSWGSRETNLAPLQTPDPVAEDANRAQADLHETLVLPRLRFHLIVLAETEATANLVGTTVAESAFENGSYQTYTHSVADIIRQVKAAVEQLTPFDHRVFPGLSAKATASGNPELGLLCHTATVDELSGAFRLPIATHDSPQCIRANTDPPIDHVDDLLVLGYDMAFEGRWGFDANAVRVWRGISLRTLARHMLACGVTGSGKTTSLIGLLLELYRRGIHWLLIECGKKEFRALKNQKGHADPIVAGLAEALRILTPGNEAVSPFRYNPLARIAGISADEHLDTLNGCFAAAMPMGGPLPSLIREGIEEVLHGAGDEKGWPVLRDIRRVMEECVARRGYSEATHLDIAGAADARFGPLTSGATGKAFQSPKSIPAIEDLMNGHTVIELDHLAKDVSSLLLHFLIQGIEANARTFGSTGGELRMVIVIEEAHLVLGRSTDAMPSEENADPSAYLTEAVCRLLAVLRSYGIGVIISTQHPSQLAPDVLKHTVTKLAFRAGTEEEREIIAGATLLDGIGKEELARLGVGEAYLFTQGYHTPRLIRVPNQGASLDLRPLSDRALRELLSMEFWYRDTMRSRVEAELGQLCREVERFRTTMGDVAHRFSHELTPHVLQRFGPERRKTEAPEVTPREERTEILHQELSEAWRRLERQVYEPVMATTDCVELDESLCSYRDSVRTVVESDVRPRTNKLLAMIQDFIRQCTGPAIV